MQRGFAAAAVLVSLICATSAAKADVISGPTLTDRDSGYAASGLILQAEDNSVLTGFTFGNQGLADTVVLTDTSGNILDSIAVAGSNVAASVSNLSWSLVAGQTYTLQQTTANNGLFTQTEGDGAYGDTDLQVIAGLFGNSVNQAQEAQSSDFYLDFNNIATTASAGGGGGPEPSTWALMMVGVFGAGIALRRRQDAGLAALA